MASLPHEDLDDLVQIGRAKVKGLDAQLRLKAAPRSSRGRILQLVMDEDAEEQFHAMAGCELSIGAAGLIFFQEQSALRQEKRDRLRRNQARQGNLRPATDGSLAAAAAAGGEEAAIVDLTLGEGAEVNQPEKEEETEEEPCNVAVPSALLPMPCDVR